MPLALAASRAPAYRALAVTVVTLALKPLRARGRLLRPHAILADGALLAAVFRSDSSRAWHLCLAFGLLTAVGVATAGLTPAVVMVQHCGSIFGATQVASAPGSALGAWLAGRIFDATGSYAVAFTIAAAAAPVAALPVWAAGCPRRP